MEEEPGEAMEREDLEDDDDLNDREVPTTKHHRHHDVLNAENLTEKLVDMDIGRQMSPRYDLFSSVDFSNIGDLTHEMQGYNANSFWKVPPTPPADLPDLD